MAEREILKWVTVQGHRIPIYVKTAVNTSSVNKALDKLKNFKLVDDINIPNPLYDKNDPDLHLADMLDLEFEGKEREGGKEIYVSMDNIRSIQGVVSKPETAKIIKAYNNISNIPVAIECNKKYFIVDGNHRAVAAKLLGIDKVKIRVMNR